MQVRPLGWEDSPGVFGQWHWVRPCNLGKETGQISPSVLGRPHHLQGPVMPKTSSKLTQRVPVTFRLGAAPA